MRTGAGLSQQELAARANLDRSYLSDLERGISTISLDVFLQICRELPIPAGKAIDKIESALK